MSRRRPRTPEPTPRPAAREPRRSTESDDPAALLAARLGEWLRRAALGLTAALLTARAYWPSEPDYQADAGNGTYWVFALLVAAGLAAASALLGGTLRLRFSGADVALIALAMLVALAAGQAIDRRPALNIAWEWGGLILAYLLIRNLPRTQGESYVLAGALAATAAAVAVYGLYQAGVEIPALQSRFVANKSRMLLAAGFTPGTPTAVSFEHRLLHSNEPYSTFALANSLAGYLVGPLVLMLSVVWRGLTDRDFKGSRWAAVGLALPPLAAVVVCLILTKSRSAYVGLAVAMLILAWRERRRVRARTLAVGAVVGLLVVAGLVAAGLKTGRLDTLVLTQAGKSFRFRQEYWVGSWRAINESSPSFWHGYGPGNFAAAYLRHKLPLASEEIKDPHNLILETWATAGFWAVVALGAAVGFGLWSAFGPPKETAPAEPVLDDAGPPASPVWLLVCAGLGWLALLGVAKASDFLGSGFERWMILGMTWLFVLACGWPLWRRRPPEPAALGAAALAVLVNLSAAGGISVPAVGIALWTTLALALNLRADRPAGRLRAAGGRLAAFALSAVWVALLGTFIGTVVPYWRCEAALARAENALASRPPDYDRAESAYETAKDADPLSARPWIAMATLDYQRWEARGAKADDLRWKKIPIAMFKANELPRPPDNWARQLDRAQFMSLVLQRLGSALPPHESIRYQANIAEALRHASRLYPTNAALHARIAESSAAMSMIDEALKEGQTALDLDRQTPHLDKKLDPSVRLWLEGKVPEWGQTTAAAQDVARPKGTPKGAKK